MGIDASAIDQVTQSFLSAFQAEASHIKGAALSLFNYLAVIQLAVSSLMMIVSGESLQRFFSRTYGMLISFSIFYACIQYGGHWVPTIINGFIEIGKSSSLDGISPGSVMMQGLSIVSGMIKSLGSWRAVTHPIVTFLVGSASVSIIILYALIAADLAIVIVKAYVLTTLASLFFAFGANEMTRSMAVNFLKTVIGLGLQLMTLYLVLSIGAKLGEKWTLMVKYAGDHHEIMPILVIMASTIVYYLIIKNVPSFIAGLSGVGGFQNYGDAAVAMAMNTGATHSKAAMDISKKGWAVGKGVGSGAAGGYRAAVKTADYLNDLHKYTKPPNG